MHETSKNTCNRKLDRASLLFAAVYLEIKPLGVREKWNCKILPKKIAWGCTNHQWRIAKQILISKSDQNYKKNPCTVIKIRLTNSEPFPSTWYIWLSKVKRATNLFILWPKHGWKQRLHRTKKGISSITGFAFLMLPT